MSPSPGINAEPAATAIGVEAPGLKPPATASLDRANLGIQVDQGSDVTKPVNSVFNAADQGIVPPPTLAPSVAQAQSPTSDYKPLGHKPPGLAPDGPAQSMDGPGRERERTRVEEPMKVDEGNLAGAAPTEFKPLPDVQKGGIEKVMDWAKENPVMAAAAVAAVVYAAQMLLSKTAGVGSGGSILGSLGVAGAGALALKAWDTFGAKKESVQTVVTKENVAVAMAKSPEVTKLFTNNPDLMRVAEKNPQVLNNLIQNPEVVKQLLANPQAVQSIIRENAEVGGANWGARGAVAAIPGLGSVMTAGFASKDFLTSRLNAAQIDKAVNSALATNPAFAEVANRNKNVIQAVKENPFLLQSVLRDPARTQEFFANRTNVEAIFTKVEAPGGWSKVKGAVLGAFSPGLGAVSGATDQQTSAIRVASEVDKIIGAPPKAEPPAPSPARA